MSTIEVSAEEAREWQESIGAASRRQERRDELSLWPQSASDPLYATQEQPHEDTVLAYVAAGAAPTGVPVRAVHRVTIRLAVKPSGCERVVRVDDFSPIYSGIGRQVATAEADRVDHEMALRAARRQLEYWQLQATDMALSTSDGVWTEADITRFIAEWQRVTEELEAET